MKLMNTKRLIVFLFAIYNLQFAISAKAQSTFSLQQAIDYAMKNSSTIKNAILDEKITDAKVKEFIGLGLPQITGSANTMDNYLKPLFVIPANSFGNPTTEYLRVGQTYSTQAGLAANWLLLDATYLIGKTAQKELLKLTKYSTTRSKIDLAEQVSKAYYDVLVADKKMELLKANIVNQEEHYKETKAALEQGFVEKIDLQRLEIALNNLKTEQAKTQELLDVGKALLKFQMGYDVQQSIFLTDSINKESFKDLGNADNSFNPDDRIEVQMLKKQMDLNKLNLKRYQYGALPNLATFGQFNTNHYSDDFDFYKHSAPYFTSGLVGLQMNVTFWNGGQTHYHKEQIKLQIQQNENDLYNLKNSIQAYLESSKTTLKNSLLSLDEQQKNMDLAAEVLRVSKIKYQQGVGANLEVLDAEKSLKEAQTNYFSALYDAYIAKVNYQKVTGTLIGH
jgi:outer membrane protein